MRKSNKILQMIALCGCFLYSTSIHATETTSHRIPIKMIEELNQPQVSVEEQQTEVNQTTQEAISLVQEEYVRITQPLKRSNLDEFDPEEVEITFSQEMNIMGEAYMDTEIQIVTYTVGNEESRVEFNELEEYPNYTEYKVKVVGATQTFNQLIKLYEGENHIIIYYNYEPLQLEGHIEFIIVRETQEKKEQLKNYIVTDPSVLLNQIPQ